MKFVANENVSKLSPAAREVLKVLVKHRRPMNLYDLIERGIDRDTAGAGLEELAAELIVRAAPFYSKKRGSTVVIYALTESGLEAAREALPDAPVIPNSSASHSTTGGTGSWNAQV